MTANPNKPRESTELRVRTFAFQAYCTRAAEYLRFRSISGKAIESSTWGPLPYLFGGLQRVRALDLGCGAGSQALEQLDLLSYLGLDLSSGLLANHVLRGKAGVTLRECDIEGPLPNLPRNFDLVIAILSLNYVADLDSVFSQVRKKGRHFYIIAPNTKFDSRNGKVNNGTTEIRFLGFDLLYYCHTIDQMVDKMGSCESITIREIGPRGLFDEPPYILIWGRW